MNQKMSRKDLKSEDTVDLKGAAKDLPKNWEVFCSKKSKRVYYYNSVTKKTQWHHPNLGEKSKSEEKSKSKKRKITSNEQYTTKSHVNNKELLKQSDKTNQTKSSFKFKKEANYMTSISKSGGQNLSPLPTRNNSEKLFLKTLSNNPQFPKPNKEIAKNNLQTTEFPHHQTLKNNSQVFHLPKTKKLANNGHNQAVITGLHKTQTVNESGKTNSQLSNLSKNNKHPVLMKSKSQNETQSKKIPQLQPLQRTKSLGEVSDSGISNSSGRILAWLADTSRINFKHHPVPNTGTEGNKAWKNKSKPSQTNVFKQERNTGKQRSEKQKAAIVDRVETNSEITKPKKDILDKLLPNQTQRKQRYTPYKTTLPVSKYNKKISQSEQNKKHIGQTASKTTASINTKNSQLNQNNASFESTRICRGKATGGPNGFITSETSVGKSLTRNNSTLCETQLFVSNEGIHDNSNVFSNLQQDDDVLSMEEGAGTEISLPSSESDVADMDIDNAEEFAKEIVQELKEMRTSVVGISYQTSRNQMAMKVTNHGYEGTLYIVLDTNVLLSHLKFVTELKDFPIPGVGMPTLVIPWIVIQELDSLKDNKKKCHENNGKTKRVDMLARVAIKFLNSSFQKPDPRVRGQTVDEAAEHVGNLQEETNDDRILQCCLLFHERAQNGTCVLFSNDVNLCNKAIVNGIKAFNHEKLLHGLKDLFQCGAIVKQHSEEYKIQLAIEEDIARQRQKADDILCELQVILREGLSYIIEIEMKKAYDDLWIEIVNIKPPWTLIDALQLLDKHWIAVFGHVLKRDKKELVDKIKQKFNERKDTAASLQFSSEMLQLAMQLFNSFARHSNYEDAIPKCLAAVNVLVQKCQQFEASVSTGVAQAKCLTYPSTSRITPVDNNNTSDMLSSNSVPHEEVMNTFNLIWTAVTQFSTQIFTALGYPNTITDGAPQDFPRASKDEAINFLHVLCPKLDNVVRSIQCVLRDPWERVSQNNNLFIQMEQAIGIFVTEILSQENNATAEKLFRFCEDASMRTSLVEGLSQLDRASAMLQHCASCVIQSSTISQ